MSNEQDMKGIRDGRLAATVILVRDSRSARGGAARDGIEVWMQERVLTMANYPGMTVFPGGGVDFRDFPSDKEEAAELWSGRPVEDIARQLDVRPRQAHAIIFAAVRELFEETGTLLLVDDEGMLLDDARPFHTMRRRMETHELSLTEMLEETGLDVNADLVKPVGRWVGKSEKGTWFDTFSFVAALPDGQEPDRVTGEASDANWFPPALLLDGWREGLVRFAKSTLAQLHDIAQYDSVDEVLAAADDARINPMIGNPAKDPRYADLYRHDPVNRIGWQL